MKYVFLLLTSLLSMHAFACIGGANKLICPGDTVYSPTGYRGDVLGVNPFKETVAVHWNKTSAGYDENQTSTFSVKDLAIGKGCLRYFCVGDAVASPSGYRGRIVGVNPYNAKAAVHWTLTSAGYDENSTSTMSIYDLALGRGCAEGYCVGDSVISQSGYSGKIVGINFGKKQAAVHWTRTSAGYDENSTSTSKIGSLSITKYCLDYEAPHREVESYITRSELYISAELVPGFEVEFYLNSNND